MQALYAEQRLRAGLAILGGAALIGLGIALTGVPVLMLAPAVVASGVYVAARGVARLLRVQSRIRALAREFGPELDPRHTRAPLSYQVYWLLLAVAEADSAASAAEREAVERFVVARFPEFARLTPIARVELATFPRQRAGALALRLRDSLSFAEAQLLFWWACLVAFSDARFSETEHDVLQQVARGLGIPGTQARAIFHHARHRASTGQRERASGGATVEPGRSRDLARLGLGPDATRVEIRRRHRELVRRFHPDAHQHLGPVAAAEATERFREIQAAYERLTGGR
jgi:tellurite resistance protein